MDFSPVSDNETKGVAHRIVSMILARTARNRTPAQQQLASEFRRLLQCFPAFSESAARAAGLTPRQHQALLAIKGFPRTGAITMHDLAQRLCIQHHSAAELTDRLVDAGLAVRRQDLKDRRRTFVDLTAAAERTLASLSAIHLHELQHLQPALLQSLNAIGRTTFSPPKRVSDDEVL